MTDTKDTKAQSKSGTKVSKTKKVEDAKKSSSKASTSKVKAEKSATSKSSPKVTAKVKEVQPKTAEVKVAETSKKVKGASSKSGEAWPSISASSINIFKELSALKVREDILHRVVHWQLAKRRAGTHDTKEEAEVSGSGKKIFKQKGTGNARQGSKRGPHFRGGAVIFGPHPRDYGYSLPKKIRQLGLKHAVASKLHSKKLHVFEALTLKTFKTSDVRDFIHNANLKDCSVLFVDEGNDNLLLGIRNIVGLDVLPTCGLNVYDILKHDVLVFSKSAVDQFEKRVGRHA